MSKIEAVLFDFDGTLMDTNDIILRSWQHAFRQIAGKEAERETLLATFGEPLELTMKNFFGGDDDEVRRNIAVYRSFHEDHFADEIRLFPGVYDTLIKLRKSGFRVALVTSRLARTTNIGIEKFGLGGIFDTVVTADDCSRHKPDPEPALTALGRLGINAEDAVMVGDTRMDIECAHNAGVTSVLVGWSAALSADRRAADLKVEPDYIIQRAEDIFNIL